MNVHTNLSIFNHNSEKNHSFAAYLLPLFIDIQINQSLT